MIRQRPGADAEIIYTDRNVHPTAGSFAMIVSDLLNRLSFLHKRTAVAYKIPVSSLPS